MGERKSARELLLEKVVAAAADGGIAGRSLREIAAGAGTSHRMLLYHFGSREGLMAAVVGFIEARQRTAMAAVADQAPNAGEAMRELWRQVSGEQLRPFVRLFFEVFGQAAAGVPGAVTMLDNLTDSWLEAGSAVAERHGYRLDARALRLSVAVSRGLLIDLLSGADPEEVAAAHALFVELAEGRS